MNLDDYKRLAGRDKVFADILLDLTEELRLTRRASERLADAMEAEVEGLKLPDD